MDSLGLITVVNKDDTGNLNQQRFIRFNIQVKGGKNDIPKNQIQRTRNKSGQCDNSRTVNEVSPSLRLWLNMAQARWNECNL